MMPPAAFWYQRDGYDTSGKRLVGRQAAGEAFLKALAHHGRSSELLCVAPSEAEFQDCERRLRELVVGVWNMEWVPPRQLDKIGRAGVVYWPDPGISKLAWARRWFGQRAFSVCGVTHTICSIAVMQDFGELATAPFQPWDALVCTSAAVKTTVENTLSQWGDYLASRCGSRPRVPIEMPIIPLGVDSAFFAGCKENKAARKTRRAMLRIPDGDLAILYVGRLNFYAKAHPIPMYLAAERAAKATGKRLHLIQVGWFEHEKEERAFRQAAQTFCPSVPCSFLDGRQPAVRQEAWSAADLFVSLSDNIQETFGLTPLEAMAAGLPVVCSDWDGYRETVRHEQDGFRIPVTMPPPGCGTNLARDYWSGELAYNSYIARVSASTAVDLDAVTQALIQLISQPDLRARMVAAGQARAREKFDWSVVIRQYEALWDELNARRQSAAQEEIAPAPAGAPPHPLLDDPYRAFSHYTDQPLAPEHVLVLSPACSPEFVAAILGDWMGGFGSDSRLPQRTWSALLADLAAKGELRIADLLAAHPGREPEAYRTVGWLLKFDIVRLKGQTSPAAESPLPAG